VAVLQLETAVGAAIPYFPDSIGINVPRSRFLPVKSTDDLFLLASNLFAVVNGTLKLSPLRAFPGLPLVKLGDEFRKVSAFLERVPQIPDLLELDHLTVSGDVTFGRGVILRGSVIIVATNGSHIDIPEGAVLENKVVSGDLRILSH